MRPYFDDPWTTDFTARVRGRGSDPTGHYILLEGSYFYPESGGQPGDRGWLGDIPVLDVQDREGEVRHYIPSGDGTPGEGLQVHARIDRIRRFDHMQQHTGQHVLSAALVRSLGAPTLSFHLGPETCTIDLQRSSITGDEVEAVEDLANQVIWEDRPIRVLYPDPEEILRLDLRKEPEVTDPVRVIDVTDFDLSPCGGTHCARTGQLGSVHVRRWEKVKGQVRLQFVVGRRALRDHRFATRTLLSVSSRLSVPEAGVVDRLQETLEQRQAVGKEVELLRRELWVREAEELLREAPPGAPLCARVEGEPEKLKVISQRLSRERSRVGLLWTARGDLVITAGEETGADASREMKDLAAAHGGRGGGQRSLAQGRFPVEALDAVLSALKLELGTPGSPERVLPARVHRSFTTRSGLPFLVRDARAGDGAPMLLYMDALLKGRPMVVLEPGEFRLTAEEQEARFKEAAAHETSLFLVAVRQGDILGALDFRAGTRRRLRHTGDFGMTVAEPYRGQGVGRALLGSLVDWCRAGGLIRRIGLGVFPDNRPALELYRSFGFQEEGRFRQAFMVDGTPVDEIRMSLLL